MGFVVNEIKVPPLYDARAKKENKRRKGYLMKNEALRSSRYNP